MGLPSRSSTDGPGAVCRQNRIGRILLSLTLILFFMMIMEKRTDASERINVGGVEDVMLLPWGIILPARIDTGAATSSLDARDIKIRDGTVTFTLAPQYSGIELTLPIIKRKIVRSSAGSEERVVVEIEVCIGSKRLLTRVNLNDRSLVKYPMLLGRNVLRKNFIVDCAQIKCTVPNCPGVKPP